MRSLFSFGILIFIFCANSASAQRRSTTIDWKKDVYGRVYCAEIAPGVGEVQRLDIQTCRQRLGTHYDWNKDVYGRVYCAEYTNQQWEIGKAEMDTCRFNSQNSYQWVKSRPGYRMCARVDHLGRVIEYVHDSFCFGNNNQHQATTHLDYAKDVYGKVYCAEYTAKGDQIQKVDINECKSIFGVLQRFRKDVYGRVYCAELTPTNDEIGRLDIAICRRNIGTEYEWRKDVYGRVYCAEVTYDSWEISKVNEQYCRYR